SDHRGTTRRSAAAESRARISVRGTERPTAREVGQPAAGETDQRARACAAGLDRRGDVAAKPPSQHFASTWGPADEARARAISRGTGTRVSIGGPHVWSQVSARSSGDGPWQRF